MRVCHVVSPGGWGRAPRWADAAAGPVWRDAGGSTRVGGCGVQLGSLGTEQLAVMMSGDFFHVQRVVANAFLGPPPREDAWQVRRRCVTKTTTPAGTASRTWSTSPPARISSTHASCQRYKTVHWTHAVEACDVQSSGVKKVDYI